MSTPLQINIANPAEKSSSDKQFALCSMCSTIIVKSTITYECVSGHILCKNCKKKCDNSGDGISEKEFYYNVGKKELKPSNTTIQDLASGDHDEAVDTTRISDYDEDTKIDVISIDTKNNDPEENPETIIEYKNDNYRESKTSIEIETDESVIAETKESSDDNKTDVQDCKILPRPVVCPVTNCAKMVIIDSIMLHFHFDHSKVPRIILGEASPEEVFLKSTSFTNEVQCLATFLVQMDKSVSKTGSKKGDSISSARNTYKESKLLLLMAVKLSTSPVQIPIPKFDAKRVFTRTIHTQTEKGNDNDKENISICPSKTSVYQSCTSKSLCEENEVIMIWLCKLDDEERVYSITLLGEDKRRGYCFIGDATHIREKQDPASLYEKSECLIVKGSAINSLYDKKNQITAIVSIIG